MFNIRAVLSMTLLAGFSLAFSVQSVKADNASAVIRPSAETVSSQEFKALVESKKPVFILDVRQKDEYYAGHIDNAALIPLNTLPDHVGELPKDKDIVVYCRSGKRSAQAVAYLRAMGYTKAVSLEGGYLACAVNSTC